VAAVVAGCGVAARRAALQLDGVDLPGLAADAGGEQPAVPAPRREPELEADLGLGDRLDAADVGQARRGPGRKDADVRRRNDVPLTQEGRI